MSQRPAVSVVMPAFNAAPTLEASVRSVLAQTWRDFELLIVDDASTDATAEQAAAFAAGGGPDRRVRLLRQRANGGVAQARNAGLEAATGKRIAFLDSDDTWAPDKLAVQLADMDATGALFSYMTYAHVSADGSVRPARIPPAHTSYRRALLGNPIGTLTVTVDAGLLGASRFQRRGHEDYALWLQLLQRIDYARRAGAQRPYAFYRAGGASLSSSKWRALRWQWDIYRRQERLPLPLALFCLSSYGVRGLAKHFL